MKFLLDENLSRRMVPFLQHDYPGSSQVMLKVLIDNKELIVESLEANGLASLAIMLW